MGFVVGDIVMLKSGGPKMTIEGIGNYLMSGGYKNGAKCSWFIDKKLERSTFDINSLDKVIE